MKTAAVNVSSAEMPVLLPEATRYRWIQIRLLIRPYSRAQGKPRGRRNSFSMTWPWFYTISRNCDANRSWIDSAPPTAAEEANGAEQCECAGGWGCGAFKSEGHVVIAADVSYD